VCSIDELKRANDRHVQRQKQIDKDLQQTGKEIRAFQTEKQIALNQLDVVVPLTLKQILCMDYDNAPDGWPASLVVDAVMGTHVLMTKADLTRLDQRTKELEEEIKTEKHNFKVRSGWEWVLREQGCL
jgi:BMFP domain-containing protein YqiC